LAIARPCRLHGRGNRAQEGSRSFLKKEPKNSSDFGLSLSENAEAETNKQRLLLFFKKAALAFACLPSPD
jgi:hypothetical protein